MSGSEVSGIGSLTPSEQAHFDSGGNTPAPETAPAATPEPAPAPAAVEPGAAPIAPAAATPPADAAKPPPGFVPLAALHAARADAAENKRNMTLLEGRLSQLAESIKAPAQPQTAPPAFDQDPANNLNARMTPVERELADLRTFKTNYEQAQNQSQQVQTISATAQAMQDQFRQTTPDYDQASAYLRTIKDQELQENGFADPVQRAQILQHQALQMAGLALQQGVNPAERAYAIAKRLGYRPAAAAQPAGQPAPAAAAPTAAALIAQVAEGQTRAGSIGAAPTVAPSKPLSAAAIIDMPEGDFAALLDKVKGNPVKMREIFGA